jgi:hypothetical protein
MESQELFLDVAFPADWSRIDPTREAVSLLVLAVFGRSDLRDSLAMVSAELLENAVKYSKSMGGVRLSIRNESKGLVVAVTNMVEEGSRHVASLRGRLEWLNSFADPEQAYAAALREVSVRGGEESGLGIVRIAYEGGCGLDCDVSSPGEITVRALCKLSQ